MDAVNTNWQVAASLKAAQAMKQVNKAGTMAGNEMAGSLSGLAAQFQDIGVTAGMVLKQK